MKKSLGLDLGSNSLGWAVLDDITGEILDKGVVVFPEGIDAANDTLETPAAVRRAKRMGRRMKFRRKMRKWALLKLLIDNGMCPMTIVELSDWRHKGKYPTENRAFIDWLKSTNAINPYADRAAAATEKVSPYVLGRALYHLCQRRGFKSSRKDATVAEEGNESVTSVVKGDIAVLTKEIASAGCKTLGQYFARCIENQKDLPYKQRIRTRYTGRNEHYEVEFAEIMRAQGLGGSQLAENLHKAIFFQRPLRSQKFLVGKCPLEPKCARAQIGHPAFEEFRALTFINNLSFEKIDTDERVELAADDRTTILSALMKASPSIKFKDINKLFKKRLAKENLRFHYYRDEDSVATCPTRHKICKAFGDISYDEQKVFDALTFFDNDELLKSWFHRHYPSLTEEQVKKLCDIHPKEGNANYSLKAIKLILPFLREGYVLSTARFLAKLPEVLKEFSANKEKILLGLKELEFKYHRLREERRDSKLKQGTTLPRLMDMYREYFLTQWGIQDEDWKRLYLRGESAYEVNPDRPDRLPAVQLGMIRNPLVQRSMTTLRRLVNYLRDHGKIDADTVIRIELARGVNDFATRHAIQVWQQDKAKKREEARAVLGGSAGEDVVDRYLLAKEQGFKCLYTGNSIKIKDIFSGNIFDIEHTIPRSLCGDDTQANKTLCDAEYNRKIKKGMIPRDCPDYESKICINLKPWREKVAELEKIYRSQSGKSRFMTDPAAKAAARIKAIKTRLELDYWRDKLRRFEITSDKLEAPENGISGFKKRQLVDTGVMCSHAVEFLKSVYPSVYSVNGAATAFARKAWGIQTDELKDRSEHTHHAKDAMVIAALTPSRFNAICSALKDDGAILYRRPCDVCPVPYPDFAEKVRKATDEILVKHVVRQTTLRQSQKKNALAKAHPLKSEPGKFVKKVLSKGDTVRGQLHKDTFYGKIQNPDDGKIITVQRIPIPIEIKDVIKIIPTIIDPAIRNLIKCTIEKYISADLKQVPSDGFKMPSGVPIKRIRVKAPSNFQNPLNIKEHVFASTKAYKQHLLAAGGADSNFRMALFDIRGKPSYKTENSFYWAQNHKYDSYIAYDKQNGFVGYVYPGKMAIAHTGGGMNEVINLPPCELRKRLYYIRTLPTDKDSHTELQYHLEAHVKKDITDRSSTIDINNPHGLIRTSAGNLLRQMLFEGIHFRMNLDGSINFLK